MCISKLLRRKSHVNVFSRRQIKGAAAAQNPYVVENNKFTAGKTNGNVRKAGAESGTDSSSYGARQGRSNF